MQKDIRKLSGSHLLNEIENLKKELETKDKVTRLCFCDDEIIKALEKEGLKVENYCVIIEECIIKKL